MKVGAAEEQAVDGAGLRLQQLFDALQSAPQQHDFYAVLRMVESLTPEAPRLGRALRPREEVLRVGQDPETTFAPAAVMSCRIDGRGVHWLGQRFFGLFGPMGPLPLHLTEFARERLRGHADPTLARFVDLFHHRAALLFFRAWAQAQPVSHLDRRGDDDYSRWISSLIGTGAEELSRRDLVDDDARRFHVGLLSRGVKCAEGLCKILSYQFDAPVRIEQHVGHWLAIDAAERTRLQPPRSQATNILGRSAVAGRKVWDRQFRFRIHLGPMSYEKYVRFLPAGRARQLVRDWVRHYVGLALRCDVIPWLRGDQVPPLRLGEPGNQGGRLGQTAWLGSRRPHPHRGDMRLHLEAHP
jgi:type VI secretion system protein ImpH